jgi:hypothetical protein
MNSLACGALSDNLTAGPTLYASSVHCLDLASFLDFQVLQDKSAVAS